MYIDVHLEIKTHGAAGKAFFAHMHYYVLDHRADRV
jgi:hypothetical protein